MNRSPKIAGIIQRHFVELRKSQRTTICALVPGLLQRSRVGYAEIARGMNDGVSVRHRIRRISRFCCNVRLSLMAITVGLIRWLGTGPNPTVVALDWTELLDDYWLLAAKVAVGHRAIPIAWRVMRAWEFGPNNLSRNAVEEDLIDRVHQAMQGRPWILIADRGFARAELFSRLQDKHICYVIRTAGNTWIRHKGFYGALDNLARHSRVLKCYPKVAYRQKRPVIVNLVLTHQEPAPEPWYLVTNLHSTAHEIVRLYRQRMWIEESFRDAKTHLGLKKFWVSKSDRLERMMILVALAMLIFVLVALDYQRKFGQKDPQLTTKRKGRTLSIFRLGQLLYSQYGLPPYLVLIRPLTEVA